MKAELNWKASDVLHAVHGHCLQEQTWEAHSVSIDSRNVKPGTLFIAIKGPSNDGHDFVAAAFANGAVAAIVSRPIAQVSAQQPLIMVDDTFKALEELGRAGRARARASIVAVTGSVGKTGTKEMLRLMLNATGSTYATEGSLNNQWGVPLSLARLPADAAYGVFELGMNHAGELSVLATQVQPRVAMITTIEAVHLEYFASLDAIADAKAEIFLGMNRDGVAVLNRDNLQFTRLAAAAKTRGLKKIFGFGRHPKADARLISCIANPDASDITADILGKKITYHLGAPGEHLALNSVGALLAASAAGSDVQACAAALAHYKLPPGRGVIRTVAVRDGTITLIDESYNASPSAVSFAIRVLGQMRPGIGGRKILVLGDMLELGATSPQLHADLAKVIVDSGVDLVFCCGEMMKHLYDALPAGGQGYYAKDSAALAPHVVEAVRSGDVMTVKGSKSMYMGTVIEVLAAAAEAFPPARTQQATGA